MPTAIPIEKLLATATAFLATTLASAAVWALPVLRGADPTPSILGPSEFSGPAARPPHRIERLLRSPSTPALQQVPCAGPARAQTCYALAP